MLLNKIRPIIDIFKLQNVTYKIHNKNLRL